MCGLVGVAGSIDTKTVSAFNDLLVINSIRGMHSTGVASVRRGDPGEADVLKSVGPPSFLQEMKSYEKVVTVGRMVLIGHGRHATVGNINHANAHPFQFNTIVGAHNGTIPWNAKRALPDHDNFGTDSEALYNSINNNGIVNTIGMLDDGAWALTYYDKVNHTMNLLRNDKRPLAYAFSEDRKTLWWASEGDMLSFVLGRHNIKIHEDEFWEMPTDELRTWDVPDNNQPFGDFHYTEVKKKEVVKHEPRFFPGSRGYGHNSYGYYDPDDWSDTPWADKKADKGSAETEKSSHSFAEPVGEDNQVTGKHATLRIAPGVTITRTQYETRTHCVCASCDKIIDWDAVIRRHEKVSFIDHNSFMCEECVDDPFIRNWTKGQRYH